MAAIRRNLQRQLFDNEQERIYAVINVKKASKKKNSSFLCITVSNSLPVTAKIVQVSLFEDEVTSN